MDLPPSPHKSSPSSLNIAEKPVLLIEVISDTSNPKIPFQLKLNPEGLEILKNLENSLVPNFYNVLNPLGCPNFDLRS